MPSDDITGWLRRLVSDDDQEAAQRLWEQYYGRLIRLARDRLRGADRRVSDEEDVVLSAFNSFCQGTRAGRFPRLDDREDLWMVLVTLTAQKAVDRFRHDHREKRGGCVVRGESAFLSADHDGQRGIEQVVGCEPTPEFAAMMVEQCDCLLNCLGDLALRRIAVMKLEQYSTVEISRELGCSVRTVKRRLAMIRAKWELAGGGVAHESPGH